MQARLAVAVIALEVAPAKPKMSNALCTPMRDDLLIKYFCALCSLTPLLSKLETISEKKVINHKDYICDESFVTN